MHLPLVIIGAAIAGIGMLMEPEKKAAATPSDTPTPKKKDETPAP